MTDSRTPLAVAPPVFAAHLEALANAGFTTLSLSELIKSVGRREPLPARALAITFDDGYRSVFEAGLSILRQYGFSATVFVVVGWCGREPGPVGRGSWTPLWPTLNWSEIDALAAAGIEVGCHSLTHPVLTQLPPARLEQEIIESQQLLEKHTGRPATLFTYPYGEVSPGVAGLVRAHYAGACGTELGLVRSHSDPYHLARVDSFYLKPRAAIRFLSSGPSRAYLSLRRWLRKARRHIRPDWAGVFSQLIV